MSRILAIVILSLGGMAGAQAASWSASPHYGYSLVPFMLTQLNPGCDNGCTNNNSPTDDPNGPSDDPPAVPEPATFALFGAGLLLGAIVVSRRRSKLRN